jgi:hypothetical protein
MTLMNLIPWTGVVLECSSWVSEGFFFFCFLLAATRMIFMKGDDLEKLCVLKSVVECLEFSCQKRLPNCEQKKKEKGMVSDKRTAGRRRQH